MITIDKTALGELLIMEELANLHATKSRLSYFERKYETSFEDFRKKVNKEEVYNEYDDFIEWKAFLDRKAALEQKISSIKSGQFRISWGE